MTHSKLLTVTTLVSPASHISCINSDSNVIAARSLSDASDICRTEGKNNNFIAVTLNSNEMDEENNFYAVKHGTMVLCNVYIKYHEMKMILLSSKIFVIKKIMLLPTFQLTYWIRLSGHKKK